MAKESSEGEFLKRKCVDRNRKMIENLAKANAVKEKVIHSDQLEFLPIFPYSEFLLWMLPAPITLILIRSVYFIIFAVLFSGKLKT